MCPGVKKADTVVKAMNAPETLYLNCIKCFKNVDNVNHILCRSGFICTSFNVHKIRF